MNGSIKSVFASLLVTASAASLSAQEASDAEKLADELQSEAAATVTTTAAATTAANAPKRFRYSFGLERSGTSFRNFFNDDEPGGISPYIQLEYGSATGLNLVGRASVNLFHDDLEDFPLDESDIGNPVSSDIRAYRQDSVTLDRLYLDYRFRLSDSVFGRMSAGALQTQYVGVDAELLYAPEASQWALGAQIGHVQKRDPEDSFATLDYETTTGHVTAYWDTGYPGWLVSASYGRYLAEDWGTTLSLAKRFENGWELRGDLTATDYYFDSDNESDFLVPKISLYIPLGAMLGTGTNRFKYDKFISSSTDAGRRLATTGDLYGQLRGYEASGYQKRWGGF